MKIEKPEAVQFKDVKVGQVFECWGKLFIKGYNFSKEEHTLVDLDNGYVNGAPMDTDEVILYKNAKVVIE